MPTPRLWLSALLITGLLCSCRPEKGADTLTVGVIAPSGSEPMDAAMRRALERKAALSDARLVWRDGEARDPSESAAEYEQNALRELIEDEDIDALIYRPADVAAAPDLFLQARAANVPVVFLDRLPPSVAADAFVTSDYVAAGEDAARRALTQLKAMGRVNTDGQLNALVIEGSWRRLRDRLTATGFYSVLDNEPIMRVVGHTSALTATEAFQFVSRELNNYAGNVQLLLVAHTEFTPGALLAVETHGYARSIVSAGVGAGEEACRLVMDGRHDFEVDLMPMERAERAFEAARQLALGETAEPDDFVESGTIEVPVRFGPRRFITRENAASMAAVWPNLLPQ